MTKIFVFSDSHGVVEAMSRRIRAGKPDMVLHLGDYTADCEELRRLFPTLEIGGVRGNCDYRSAAPELLQFTVEGRKIFAAHGHLYHVKNSYNTICYAALEADADILLFGHTHIPWRERVLGIEAMNPGSAGRGARPTYGEILLDGERLEMAVHAL